MTIYALMSKIARMGDPAVELAKIDRYIDLKLAAPKTFELPEKDAKYLPVIERFSTDLKGFLDFVKETRDAVGAIHGYQSLQYNGVYELGRTLQIRYSQRKRRSLSQPAAQLLKDLYPDKTYEERVYYLGLLSKRWKHERLEAERELRHRRGKALSQDEKNDLADRLLDKNIEKILRGELPPWDEIVST